MSVKRSESALQRIHKMRAMGTQSKRLGPALPVASAQSASGMAGMGGSVHPASARSESVAAPALFAEQNGPMPDRDRTASNAGLNGVAEEATSKREDGQHFEAEVFSSGTWNGDRFTEADLQEIVTNFKRLYPQLIPPLKLGHDESQNLLGQSDGDPALGWVTDLWVKDDKLLARFSHVPEIIYALIKNKRYRCISAEIYLNLHHEDQPIGKALKAVALLGADLPAVTNLQALSVLLPSAPAAANDQSVPRAATAAAGPVTKDQDVSHRDAAPQTIAGTAKSVPTLGNVEQWRAFQMPPLAVISAARSAELSSAAVGFTQRSVPPIEVTQAAADHTRVEHAFADQGLEQTSQPTRTYADVAAFCEARVRDGTLSPQERTALLEALQGQVRHYTRSADLQLPLDWVLRFIQQRSALLPQGEVALAFAADAPHAALIPDAQPFNPAQLLLARTRALMKSEALPYAAAAERVLQADPALSAAYRHYTVHPTHFEENTP